MKSAHIFFSGEVQGVGFRFTAKNLAREHRIKGWVRNLDDGRVEVVAQASEEAISEFISDLKESFKNYISDVNINYDYIAEDFKDFNIAF